MTILSWKWSYITQYNGQRIYQCKILKYKYFKVKFCSFKHVRYWKDKIQPCTMNEWMDWDGWIGR